MPFQASVFQRSNDTAAVVFDFLSFNVFSWGEFTTRSEEPHQMEHCAITHLTGQPRVPLSVRSPSARHASLRNPWRPKHQRPKGDCQSEPLRCERLFGIAQKGVAKKSRLEQFDPNYEISPSAISALLNPKRHFVPNPPSLASLFNSKPARQLHRIAFLPRSLTSSYFIL
jgi:hypothetical protein